MDAQLCFMLKSSFLQACCIKAKQKWKLFQKLHQYKYKRQRQIQVSGKVHGTVSFKI